MNLPRLPENLRWGKMDIGLKCTLGGGCVRLCACTHVLPLHHMLPHTACPTPHHTTHMHACMHACTQHNQNAASNRSRDNDSGLRGDRAAQPAGARGHGAAAV